MGGGRVREDEGLEILDGKCRAEFLRSCRGCHANFEADVMKQVGGTKKMGELLKNSVHLLLLRLDSAVSHHHALECSFKYNLSFPTGRLTDSRIWKFNYALSHDLISQLSDGKGRKRGQGQAAHAEREPVQLPTWSADSSREEGRKGGSGGREKVGAKIGSCGGHREKKHG